MQGFWKWLMRANARGVFGAALIALALVVAWWTWRELAPPPATPSAPPGAGGKVATDRLGFAEYLEHQLDPASSLIRGNPFLLLGRTRPPVVNSAVIITPIAAVPPRIEPLPRLRDILGALVKPKIISRARVPARIEIPKVIPHFTPPPAVHLIYRGVFKRPDGSTAVWLEDSETGQTTFHNLGSTVHGVRLTRATTGELTVRTSDGTMDKIKFGEDASFRGGRHVR